MTNHGAAGLAGELPWHGTKVPTLETGRAASPSPSAAERQRIRDEETCNRWASAACEMAAVVSSGPAPLAVRLRELRRLASIAEFYAGRLELQRPPGERGT